MSRKAKRVGVFHIDNYNWHRNITRHNHDDYKFRRFYDWCRVSNGIRRRMGRWSTFCEYTRRPPSIPRVDLYHHWRMVDFGSTPWVVSTSTGLPFGWDKERYREGLELLASNACKQIIVTGPCAKAWQRRKAQRAPDLADDIMGKVVVIPPAQKVLISDTEGKQIGSEGPLKLAMVGNHFFRKGGLELLRVVEQLIDEGANITLDIISSLSTTSQTGDTQADRYEALQIIDGLSEVTWHGKQPHEVVINLFRQSHVGVLPSYIETYGYTVLEAQACGCATITSDIKAFPDINPDAVGWQVKISGDDYDFRTEEGRTLISKRLEHGLYSILSEAQNIPDKVLDKGRAALQRIRKYHSPKQHKTTLRSIYDQALSTS